MNEYETTINSLEQLLLWINEDDFDNIAYIENETCRYSIALETAIKVLKKSKQSEEKE